MLDVTPNPLQRLGRERRPCHSLEAPFYTSPEIFAADMEIIFGRHWIYVGVEPDVPEAGDVMVVEIGRASAHPAVPARQKAGEPEMACCAGRIRPGTSARRMAASSSIWHDAPM